VSGETQGDGRPPGGAELARLARRAVGVVHGMVLLRRHGARVGYRPEFRGRVVIHAHGSLWIGDNFIVVGRPLPTKFTVARDARLEIGDSVVINYGVDINAQCEITIGDFALIAPSVSIVDDDMHEVAPGRRKRAPIHIGTNVWVARGAAIGPGVSIGDHSVVAANSAVAQDVPPASLVGGVPAKVIRDLEVPDDWRRR
jgi:maltose O-acetyltransferase